MGLSVYLEENRCPECGRSDQVFEANITHNLIPMAKAAGIFRHLWRPEEVGVYVAGDLVKELEGALEQMKSDPEAFRELNPTNGWGTYEHFITWLEAYLGACESHPKSTIRVCR